MAQGQIGTGCEEATTLLNVLLLVSSWQQKIRCWASSILTKMSRCDALIKGRLTQKVRKRRCVNGPSKEEEEEEEQLAAACPEVQERSANRHKSSPENSFVSSQLERSRKWMDG